MTTANRTQKKRLQQPAYLIQEPTTGLYAAIEGDSARLTYAPHASRFPTHSAAAAAASAARLTEQPHELVRVDA